MRLNRVDIIQIKQREVHCKRQEDNMHTSYAQHNTMKDVVNIDHIICSSSNIHFSKSILTAFNVCYFQLYVHDVSRLNKNIMHVAAKSN